MFIHISKFAKCIGGRRPPLALATNSPKKVHYTCRKQINISELPALERFRRMVDGLEEGSLPHVRCRDWHANSRARYAKRQSVTNILQTKWNVYIFEGSFEFQCELRRKIHLCLKCAKDQGKSQVLKSNTCLTESLISDCYIFYIFYSPNLASDLGRGRHRGLRLRLHRVQHGMAYSAKWSAWLA